MERNDFGLGILDFGFKGGNSARSKIPNPKSKIKIPKELNNGL
jgi:hypothetical protein